MLADKTSASIEMAEFQQLVKRARINVDNATLVYLKLKDASQQKIVGKTLFTRRDITQWDTWVRQFANQTTTEGTPFCEWLMEYGHLAHEVCQVLLCADYMDDLELLALGSAEYIQLTGDVYVSLTLMSAYTIALED